MLSALVAIALSFLTAGFAVAVALAAERVSRRSGTCSRRSLWRLMERAGKGERHRVKETANPVHGTENITVWLCARV
jgi:hypothetical protein